MNSRIAPTPSGFLHSGNAANFLLTHLIVKAHDGKLLLRIDDLDAGRSRPEYVAHIFKTIKALGITVDEGPVSSLDLRQNWSQHHRLDDYRSLLEQLVATGKVYACACSRKVVAAEAINGHYSGRCRNHQLPLDQQGASWRINTRGQNSISLPGFTEGNYLTIDLENTMGDFMIRKKDGMPAYQLCSLSDDLRFGIDLIVRGEDLLLSSAAQVYLAQLTNKTAWLAALRTLHHSLLTDASGQKLSKSAGALAIQLAESDRVAASRKPLLNIIEAWLKEMESSVAARLSAYLEVL